MENQYVHWGRITDSPPVSDIRIEFSEGSALGVESGKIPDGSYAARFVSRKREFTPTPFVSGTDREVAKLALIQAYCEFY